jgi:hypothetical protein
VSSEKKTRSPRSSRPPTRAPVRDWIDRPARQVDADSREDVLHQARAIERIGPGARARSHERRALRTFRRLHWTYLAVLLSGFL